MCPLSFGTEEFQFIIILDIGLAPLPIIANDTMPSKKSPEDNNTENRQFSTPRDAKSNKADKNKNAKTRSISRVSETIPTSVMNPSNSMESVVSMKESLQDFGLAVPWGGGGASNRSNISKNAVSSLARETTNLATPNVSEATAQTLAMNGPALQNTGLNSVHSGSTSTLIAISANQTPGTPHVVDPSANPPIYPTANSLPGIARVM